MLVPPAIIIIHICKIERNCSIHSCMYKTRGIRKLMEKVYNLLGLFVRSLDIRTCLVETLRDTFSCRKLMCCGVWGLFCWLSISQCTIMCGHCPPPSVLERTSKQGHCPSPSVLRGNQASSSPRSGGCPPHRNTKADWLAGWWWEASSADAHVGTYHHRCAHLLDCCIDLLLLLLHCFSCIATSLIIVRTQNVFLIISSHLHLAPHKTWGNKWFSSLLHSLQTLGAKTPPHLLCCCMHPPNPNNHACRIRKVEEQQHNYCNICTSALHHLPISEQ